MAGTLYIVATPIGNRADFTPRAIETLRGVSLIVAEDTRHSAPLLAWAGISTSVRSYHAHNEAEQAPRLVERLLEGNDIALISDAGTPLVSDPGARLVDAAIAAGVTVVPIPGASAIMTALVASGLPATAFTFVGFLPRAATERAASARAAVESPHTVIMYEAPPRVSDLLETLAAAGGAERRAVVARELTKLHEEFRRGTVAELAAYYGATPPRGEVVILLDGAPPVVPDQEAAARRAEALRAGGTSVRDTVRHLQEEFGVSRNEAYRLAQDT
ncbi:MAG TPA: 16S rRNA (cytidine(1402)-2'-O)-methyltransferase [Gemmatimonadaceae bacterium]|nr:16S rRNA (cytidine(1402)-2'-O)-methyltransferase [Gemmatimonadaceae bacterium]